MTNHDQGSASEKEREWPQLDDGALFGLAGEVVALLRPHTEADDAAVLVTLLVAFGSAIGASAAVRVGGAEHPARLFAVLVGETAKARKGQSWRDTRRLLFLADPDWAGRGIVSGLASGEGLIAHLQRGPAATLVIEEEFARPLAAAGRDGSTLSQVIRQAWDDSTLRVMTREEPLAVQEAHVSIIGHVTLDELQHRLRLADIGNGFANRFLWVAVRRSKRLPSGGSLADEELGALAMKLGTAITTARGQGALSRTADAETLWEKIYDELAEDDPGGLLGAATARAEAQVLRLSVAYALLDSSHSVDVPHLEAAYALWRYCRASAAYIFGTSRHRDPRLERLLRAVEAAGELGLDGAAQHKALGGHQPADEVERLRKMLVAEGLAVQFPERSGGRNRMMLYEANTAAAKNATEAKKPDLP
jgi:hypothetical protein